jgi:carboxylesterase
VIPLVLLAVLVAAITVHSIWRRVVERAVMRRLPVGPEGIISGAEPIEPGQPPAREALLLLHGFGDTPQTFAKLAVRLRARGFAVWAPLLPGHGRTLRDFRASGRDVWLAAAREALAATMMRHERVGVVGLSMGGALAVVLAAESRDITALALLAPYIEPPGSVRTLARAATVVGSVMPYLTGNSRRSIHDPIERLRAVSYRAVPPRLVRELVKLAARAREDLPRVSAPTLYIQSREDNRLTSGGAERAFAALGSATKELEWVSGAGHVITVDYGWEHVAQRVGDWMERYVRAGAGAMS